MVIYNPIGTSSDPLRERDSRELSEVLRDVKNIRLVALSVVSGGSETIRHGSRVRPTILVQGIGSGVTAELTSLTQTIATISVNGPSGAHEVLVAIIDPS